MRSVSGVCSSLLFFLVLQITIGLPAQTPPPRGYETLVRLFDDWRSFQKPRMVDGVPDYSSTAMTAQFLGLEEYRSRLSAIDTSGWPVSARVDFLLVWAEMNGLTFDHQVLRPWERIPAFYATFWPDQSDVPAHEGPTAAGTIDAWTYAFPLSRADASQLAAQLRAIPSLLEQAMQNLRGDGRDLWIGGIRRMKQQSGDLRTFIRRLEEHAEVISTANAALRATDRFIAWLEGELPAKRGTSGVGVMEYNWYLKHVQLVSHTWQDEVAHMRSELARAHASLRLEEHRNRGLPVLALPASGEEYDRTHQEAVTRFIDFLETREIVSIRPHMDAALRAKVGSISSSGAPEHFFAEVDYRDPLTMRTHGYHWIELARMREEPHASPIRRTPLLYNMFQYRSEGIATGMEEFAMHAGLFDDSPRSRELIWILVAQRAARALGGLYVHANTYSLEEAADFAVSWTPRGWFRKNGALVLFEQDLYLAQPGYGSTYLMGKLHIQKLMAERAKQLGEAFSVRRFMDEFSAAGVIPVSLIRWEMTGEDDEIGRIVK